MVICNICGKPLPVAAFFFHSHPHKITCPGCESDLVADKATMNRMTVLMLAGAMALIPGVRYLERNVGPLNALLAFVLIILFLVFLSMAVNARVGSYVYREEDGDNDSFRELWKCIAFFVIYVGIAVVFFKVAPMVWGVIPAPEDMRFIPAFLIGSWFFSSVVVTLVFCYPLALLFGRGSVVLAIVCMVPFIEAMDLLDFSRKPLSLLWSWMDFCVLFSLFVFGTYRAQKKLTHRSGGYV